MQQLIEKGRLVLRLMNDQRVSTWVRYGIPLFILLYFVSPIDVIPDFIVGLGQLDDFGVVLLGMNLMIRFSPDHVVGEHRRALGYDVAETTERTAPAGSSRDGRDGGSANYWNTPPSKNGQATTRMSDRSRPLDGEYRVVGDR